MRKCGVLMPISSLPSRFGIGGFSKEAYDFVDFLKKAGQSLWQILPLGPTGYGDSPYQSFSTFAGNPYYISLDLLIDEGLLTQKECEAFDCGTNPSYVDYEKIYLSRFKLLEKAFNRAKLDTDADYKKFIEDNSSWLKDYALYMAIKDSKGGTPWITWEEDIRLRKPEAMKKYSQKLEKEIAFYYFQQYLFNKQWMELKKYANSNGIEIVGDIPIYVAFDGADAWANPELFQLNSDNIPIAVAGCPPDAFSATGQLWGNPLYKWDYHAKTGYKWWIKRLEHCFKLYDIVRIDHFRGFDEYWAVPYGDPTAENGKWEKGPGYDLFDAMKKALGNRPVIAEDLGFLTPSVIKLVKKTGYPGMKIIEFAFDSREDSDYLPHNYVANSVVYTGTHDNDTVNGWMNCMNRRDLAFAKRYSNTKRSKDFCYNMIRLALASVSETAIIPIQDYLELGSEARINTPSTLGDNWKWRITTSQYNDELASKLNMLAATYARIPNKKKK